MHHYRSCEGVNGGFGGRGAPVLKVLRSYNQTNKHGRGAPVLKVLRSYNQTNKQVNILTNKVVEPQF